MLIYANVGFGRWAEAEANATEACALFRALGNQAMEVDCLCQAASDQINQGRPHDGIATARPAYAMSLAIENICGQANSSITLALRLVETGSYGEARDQGYDQRLGHSPRYRIPYLRARAVLAEYHGEITRAIEDLREAAQLADEIGLPGELWPIYAHTGTLYQEYGNADQAHHAFAHAAALVHTLAKSIEDRQHRANFLAAPRVRYVLERGA